MKNLEVYNGENITITVVTDYGSFKIQPNSSTAVKVAEDAIFNTADFYVEEEGNWYAKTENCNTNCNIEIYNAN